MDLRDFAEKLYVSGTAQEAEFAKEILEYIDSDMTENYHGLCEEIEVQGGEACEGKTPIKIIEFLGDRDCVLADIDDMISEYAEPLKMAGIEAVDVDDIIRTLLERLPTEWDL